MSARAMDWAWAQMPNAGATPAFITLLWLADAANVRGEYTAERSDLAASLCCDERTVSRHMAKLEELGLVQRKPDTRADGGRGPNLYVLALTPLTTGVKGGAGVKGVVVANNGGPSDNSSREDQQEQLLDPKVDVGKGRPRIEIDRARLTADEWRLAQHIAAKFNELNVKAGGKATNLLTTKGRATDDLRAIVCRIREDPQLTLADHTRIIEAEFAEPWWGKAFAGSVRVIYSPNSWARAKSATAKRRTDRRRFKGERQPTGKDAEDWEW